MTKKDVIVRQIKSVWNKRYREEIKLDDRKIVRRADTLQRITYVLVSLVTFYLVETQLLAPENSIPVLYNLFLSVILAALLIFIICPVIYFTIGNIFLKG